MSPKIEHADLVLGNRAEQAENALATHSGSLYWTDATRRQIHYYNPDARPDQQSTSWNIGEEAGCLALDQDPHFLIVALRRTIHRLDTRSGELGLLATADFTSPALRFHNGSCDSQGRLWLGMQDADARRHAAVQCLDGSGILRRREIVDVSSSEGLAWSPDDSTLFHADGPTQLVSRYDYYSDSASLGGGRPFIDLEPTNETPTGAAVDSEGNYWLALYGSGKVAQFSPQGVRLREIIVDAPLPTSVALGGSDHQTLFITTARNGLDGSTLSRYPDSGGLFAVQVEVPGWPETPHRHTGVI